MKSRNHSLLCLHTPPPISMRMPRRINLGNALRVLLTEGREDSNKGGRACDGGPHKEMSSERVRESRVATNDPTCGCHAGHVCSDCGPTPLFVGEHQLYINLRPIPIPSIQPPHLTLSRRPRHRLLLLSVGHLRRRRPPTLFWFSSAQQSCPPPPPPPRKYARASSATAAVLGAQTHPRLSG